MEWRPGTAALPGLSAHDAFEITHNFGMHREEAPSVVSHKSLVFGCSKNAPGQGVRTEPTRSGL
jgi:hypothetical protein